MIFKPSEFACKMIEKYQKSGGGSKLFNTCCNFEPTCSEYAKQAIKSKGLVFALPIILNRLKRCNDPDKVEPESDPFIERKHV